MPAYLAIRFAAAAVLLAVALAATRQPLAAALREGWRGGRDVSAPDTPTPTAVDERGRSAQTFLVDVVVRSGGTERGAVARGQDIYAVTAPLAVEAVCRILMGQTRAVGVASAGGIFDAPDFLRALSTHISLELRQ